MATVRITGQMDANMLVSGKMVSSRVMVGSLVHQAWRDKGIGRMERELVGQITSDYV